MVENQAVRKNFLTYLEAGGIKSEPLYNQELYSLLFNPNVLQEHTLALISGKNELNGFLCQLCSFRLCKRERHEVVIETTIVGYQLWRSFSKALT